MAEEAAETGTAEQVPAAAPVVPAPEKEVKDDKEATATERVDNLLRVSGGDSDADSKEAVPQDPLLKKEAPPVEKAEGLLKNTADADAGGKESLAKTYFDDFDKLSEDKKKDAIELVMQDDRDWKSWFDSGKEVHGQGDRDLAVLAARNDIEPGFLSENGIYSLKDFKERLLNEKAKSNEDAWVLADPTDEEQLKEFLDVNIGIPSDPKDYGDEWYAGTVYEDEELRGALFDQIVKTKLTRGQAASWAQFDDARQATLEQRTQEDINDYIGKSRDLLEKVYKEQTPEVLSAVSNALNSNVYGRQLLEEFGQGKFLNSPNLIGFLHDILFGHMTSWKGNNVNLDRAANESIENVNLEHLSTQQLEEMIEDLDGREHANPIYSDHHDPAAKQKYRNILALRDRVQKEIYRRLG